MRIARASAITGLDIRPGPDHRPPRVHFRAYYADGSFCCEVRGLGESQSLQRLVDFAYQLVQDIVFERDGWRCVRCGSFRDLHTHHKIHRSFERLDQPDVLECLCAFCHRQEHEEKRAC